MATAGYFIRGSETWELVRLDERDGEEVVASGLSYAEAEALYWQKLEELPRAPAAAGELPVDDGDIAPRRRRARQLTLKF